MTVKTTLNMNKEILDKIQSAADESGISKSEIIALLLKKVMSCDTGKAVPSGAVKYQDSDVGEWHKFHLSLKDDEYDYFTDLRKILKKSVSLIVALAVKKYLNEIFYDKQGDNCDFQDYIMTKESVDGVICWKIFWGNPNNIGKSIPLS